MTRRLRAVCQCSLIAALLSVLPAQTRSGVPETVSGSGCVQAGVERGCLVLYDPATETRYNLFFHGLKPLPGTPIEFKGTFDPNRGTYCMQGKIVHVTEWHKTAASCAPPSPDKK